MTLDRTLLTVSNTERRTQTERLLLAIAGVFIFVGFAALALKTSPDLTYWTRAVTWTVCAVLGTIILARRLPNRDPLLFPLAMFLSGWGLILIQRLAPAFAARQTVWLIVSVGVMLVVVLSPNILTWLRQYRYTLLLVGLVLLVSTIILGENPSGAGPALWLGFGDIFFQPSEILKVILVAFLASYLGEQYPAMRAAALHGDQRTSWLAPQIIGPILLMWGLTVIVTLWQRDLGTAILYFLVFLILLYVASGYTIILLSGAVLIALAAFAAYYLFDVVQLRIDIWLNPWPEADGRAYQIVQSLMAFASGSVFGQGIGQGSPQYIPVIHSDFIFAALAEEWGLIGIIGVIGVLSVMVARGMNTAALQPGRPFYTLLSVGLAMMLGIQSLLIMGGVLKVVPLTGVTLPFMSYGGSSLVTSFVVIGLLLRLSAGER